MYLDIHQTSYTQCMYTQTLYKYAHRLYILPGTIKPPLLLSPAMKPSRWETRG